MVAVQCHIIHASHHFNYISSFQICYHASAWMTCMACGYVGLHSPQPKLQHVSAQVGM